MHKFVISLCLLLLVLNISDTYCASEPSVISAKVHTSPEKTATDALIIDTKISLSVLLGAVVGSLLGALSSYFINRKLKTAETRDKQNSLAFVHFIQLTEGTALYLLLKNTFSNILEQLGEPDKDDKFEASHAVAVVVADMYAKLITAGEAKAIFANLMPMIDAAADSLDRVVLTSQQLAELPKDSVYCYARYVRFAKQIKSGLAILKSSIENSTPDLVNAKFVYGFWLSTKNYFDAVGVLRAAMMQCGGISNEYATQALARQYEALRVETAETMANAPKVEEALKDYKASESKGV